MFTRQEIARLRALAASCRELAHRLSLRPDREAMEAQARRYDEAADRLERAAPSPIRVPAEMTLR